MSFTPSKYQQNIYDWISNGKGSAIINAVAGSGKTTTIVNAVKLIPSSQKVAFFAFNKSIATEIEKMVPDGTYTKTIHSHGYRLWKSYVKKRSYANNEKFNPKQAPDQYKLKKLINNNMTLEAKQLFGTEIEDLVCKARADGLAPNIENITPIIEDTFENWVSIIQKYGIPIKPHDQKAAIEYARQILKESIEATWPVDFDEMLYFPAIVEVQPDEQFDWVFVDEAQDLSSVQRILLEKSLKPEGRLVAVGDPFQAIYGFRGASSDSMSLLKNHFRCQELELSICYRCANSIIKLAKQIVPHIEGREDAEDGEVNVDCKSVNLDTLDENSMIICRNNAPLVKVAFELLKLNHPLNVQLGSFDKELKSTIKNISDDINTKSDLIKQLKELEETSINDALECKLPQLVEKIQDRFESLINIVTATNSSSKDELLLSLTNLVKNENGTTICSIHKSKGLEKDNTLIVDIDLLPSKHATLDWQKAQEKNLLYVAYTRAKKSLSMIESKTIIFKKTSRASFNKKTPHQRKPSKIVRNIFKIFKDK